MKTIFFLLSGVCHQYADRCFAFEWHPLPLCARCMGTFLGLSVTLLFLVLIRSGHKSGWPRWPVCVLGGLLIGLWVLDSVNSTALGWMGHALYGMSSKSVRLLIGMGNGLGWALLVAPLANGFIWRDDVPTPLLDHLWQLPLPALILAGLASLIVYWRRAPFLLWFLVASVATLGSLTFINGLVVLIMTRRDGRLTRWVQFIPHLAGGLVLTLFELSTVAFLRKLVGI